jgi:predicted outer membrane repeat protein
VCEVKRCVFQNNSSMFGGALSNFGGTAIIDSCLFEANHVNRDGGAVYHKHECTATFVNCVFNDNEGGRLGGAMTISTEPSDVSVINCTFNRNRAKNPGGALYAAGTLTATAANCIFWGNIPDQIAGGAAITYCDVQGGLQGQGNIDVDPLFADADSDDYHLKSRAGRWLADGRSGWVVDNVTSPCIDAGDPAMPVGNEPEPNGGRINMGAYGGTTEASKSP